MCRLLWAFDFGDDAIPSVRVDGFPVPVLMLIQKGAVKLRIKVRHGGETKKEACVAPP
jgi:hypothetical protein